VKENPPGRDRLDLRVGTQAGFKAAMLQALSRQPALARLKARTDDDPSVALADAWACVLDVLAFYQERIAGEGYLRTATEDLSVRELARTVGYELSPGVAADCPLAFTLETAAGAPAQVTIEAGTRAQSLPGPGQLPQTFETTAALDARPDWNALGARRSVFLRVGPGATEAFLAGAAGDLRPGDTVVVVGRERETGPASRAWALRTLTEVDVRRAEGITRIAWDAGIGKGGAGDEQAPDPADARLFALRLRAGVFGHNAPDWRTLPDEIQEKFKPTLPPLPPSKQADKEREREGENVYSDWPRFTVVPSGATGNVVNLDALHPEVVPGSWAALVSPTATELYGVLEAKAVAAADFALAGTVTQLTLSGAAIAQRFDRQVRETLVLADSGELALAEAPLTEPVQGATVELAAPVPRLPGGRLLVASGRRARFTVAAGVHGLTLATDGGGAAVALHPGDVLQVLAPSLAAPAADGTRAWRVGTDAGQTGEVRALDEQLVALPPPDDDPVLRELVVAADPPPEAPATQTVVELTAPLGQAYDRASFQLLANVAPASHGASTAQVLGSGDASASLQGFRLQQGPLTYVRAATAGGAASTLEIRVDGVRWTEVPSLLGAGPRDRVYTVRIGDDGTATVQFGDGVHGARLPSGNENVVASYRVGTGLAGNVAADQVTLLLTRPLGVRGVTNPLPAGLAADPEAGDLARRNAPRTALTFDRVVSLTDYEELTRSFSGIAKASAGWVWDRETRLVHLTVAGELGAPVDPATRDALLAALHGAGDPHTRLRVDSYQPVTFDVALLLFVAPAYEAAAVRAAVAAALAEAFSFERRDLGQPVSRSEVGGVVQAVPGVAGVTLTTLAVHGDTGVATLLAARKGVGDGTAVLPAQLLTLDPTGLSFAEQQA
jgi:hypothetical protein